MKEKIMSYIETLEAKAYQSDDYFKQRNELYIENQNKNKEIERLNNIINELEKELNKDFNTYMTGNRQNGKIYKAGANNYRMHIYLRLKELKGSDKE